LCLLAIIFRSVRKSLTDRMELLISNLRITRKDFAEKINFSQSYVTMVTNGTKPAPSKRFLDAVCREFSVNPEWLTDGKGDMFAPQGLEASPLKTEILVKLNLLPPQEQKTVEDIIDAFLSREQLTGNIK